MALGGVLVFGGVFACVHAFRKRMLAQRIERMPVTPIDGASGFVKLQGSVGAEKTVKSPFSKTDCVISEYLIEERRRRKGRDGKDDERWVRTRGGSRRLRFGLTDDSGSLWVEPASAKVFLRDRRQWYYNANIINSIKSFVEKLKNWDSGGDDVLFDMSQDGIDEVEPGSFRWGSVSPGDRRFTESYLAPGDTAYVLGRVSASGNQGGVVKGGSHFVVSDEPLGKALGKGFWFILVLGVLLAGVGVWVFLL